MNIKFAALLAAAALSVAACEQQAATTRPSLGNPGRRHHFHHFGRYSVRTARRRTANPDQ